MEFPIYRADISENDNDDVEVSFIALVNKPAIQKNFVAFEALPQRYAVQNEDERIITGLAMVANLPIYRRDKSGEFYVYYDAETIEKIVQRFFRKRYNFRLNLSHNADFQIEDSFVFESWIVDRAKGKFPMKEFEDVEDGSWIISVKINDPEIWEAIKRGEFKGFSVEGFFNLQRAEFSETSDEMSDEEFVEELKKMLQDYAL